MVVWLFRIVINSTEFACIVLYITHFVLVRFVFFFSSLLFVMLAYNLGLYTKQDTDTHMMHDTFEVRNHICESSTNAQIEKTDTGTSTTWSLSSSHHATHDTLFVHIIVSRKTAFFHTLVQHSTHMQTHHTAPTYKHTHP